MLLACYSSSCYKDSQGNHYLHQKAPCYSRHGKPWPLDATPHCFLSVPAVWGGSLGRVRGGREGERGR